MGAVDAAPLASCLPVNAFVNPNVATVALDAGNVIVTPSVPASVRPALTVNVLALASVIVPVLVVRVRLLIVPGSTTLDGKENVQVPVVVMVQVPVTVICPVVPATVMLVTVPEPPPPPPVPLTTQDPAALVAENAGTTV
jgi:hypothetical protein